MAIVHQSVNQFSIQNPVLYTQDFLPNVFEVFEGIKQHTSERWPKAIYHWCKFFMEQHDGSYQSLVLERDI